MQEWLADKYNYISEGLRHASNDEYIWMIIVGTILAYILGFAMGANDVSNAFGTSVGSRALSLTQAYILASIFEALGAIIIGYNVIDTVRRSIYDVGIYESEPVLFMLVQIAVLGGCSLWLLLATALKMPVSASHSLVGAILGSTLACKGFRGIYWEMLLYIVGSWFLSPVLAGLTSITILLLIEHNILQSRDPVNRALFCSPFIVFACFVVNGFIVLLGGSKILNTPSLSIWVCIPICTTIAVLAASFYYYLILPQIRNKIDEMIILEPLIFKKDDLSSGVSPSVKEITDGFCHPPRYFRRKLAGRDSDSSFEYTETPTSSDSEGSGLFGGFWRNLMPKKDLEIDTRVMKAFVGLQVMSACFAGFAHGSNDVSNAIGPLTTLMNAYREKDFQQKHETSIDVLFFGICSICAGLWVLGHRVILTIGLDMTEMNPVTGFVMEFGAATTTILASKLGLPISTTHCVIGAVVAVGWVKSETGVDIKVIKQIAASWLVTVPVSGIFAGIIILILQATVYKKFYFF
ncbi:unnamed protein product [Caenorhabditis auriculariae]|uniref:Phosphate transporter n=1 Tax=Caenorhabditis auriculariae TaxID=2777116 RepID=A0A8S1H8E1_9PELO|nr:unnamed protein product [Caenorhabditis auriculariae]